MPKVYPTRSPGFRFKDGKLYLFAPDAIMVIKGWPELEAVCKRDGGGGWTAFDPEMRLVRPYRRSVAAKVKAPANDVPLFEAAGVAVERRRPLAEQRKAAFDAFRFRLPTAVARGVERFPSHQWFPLRLFNLKPIEAADLFEANPALAFCLANHHKLTKVTRGTPAERAAGIIDRRQRDILWFLHFPPSQAVVRALAKIVPESLNADRLRAIRLAMEDEAVLKLLGHLPRINAGVLGIVTEPVLLACVTPSFLQEAAEDGSQNYHSPLPDLLLDTLEMMRVVHPGRQAGPYKSAARLREAHAELGVAYCRAAPANLADCNFPRPPIPGIPQIVPLSTPAALAAEGADQHNCVASYAKRVAAGDVYIYRVTAPERATLSVSRRADGEWRMGDLKAVHNTWVKPETAQFVEKWLQHYRLGV